MSKLTSIECSAQWVDHLIHESVAERPAEAARQRLFVIPRLMASACALTGAPIWLMLHGAPTVAEGVIFALTQIPLVSVAILARTGKLRLAQYVSALGWFALALATYALIEGCEAVSVALLVIALSEAAINSLIAMTVAIGVAAVWLIATSAGAGAFSIDAAIIVTPLLIYAAFAAICAIRAERTGAVGDPKSARDLRLLMDAIGDIVLHFDRSGAVVNVLGDTHKTYGLDRRDLIGRGFFQRVHIADRPAFLKLVSDVSDKDAPMTGLLRVQIGLTPSASGKYVEPVFNYFEARMCLARQIEDDSSDGPTNASSQPVVCILRDVTAGKRAEEAIALARAESERAAASKSRFLANVSHELRTPLNAIIGFSEMLATEGLAPIEPAKQREYAQIVANSGNHLLEVVNTILDMSKIESGAMQIFPEPFDVPSLIDQCCDMVQLKADQGGVDLLRDYGRDLVELVGDKRACKQILLNLLSNAVKFTPPGGRVWVRVAPEGNLLAVTVADTGIGIAAGDLVRLGDPFFQASSSHDRAYEGTGLGLSVVRGLVGLHGGTISIESALKKGASVTVRLPLDCREQAQGVCAAAKIETFPRHGAAIGLDVGHEKKTVKKIA